MRSHYKIKDSLKILPFNTSEIKKSKKKRNKILQIIDFYQNYHFFLKKLKILLIIKNQENFHFFQKDLKDLKD